MLSCYGKAIISTCQRFLFDERATAILQLEISYFFSLFKLYSGKLIGLCVLEFDYED